MKSRPRFSIAALMGVVLVSALGLAALRSGSATYAGGLYLLTHGVFALALVGVACRGASERAWWLGFALFGLGYLRGMTRQGYGPPLMLPTVALLEAIRPDGVKPLVVNSFSAENINSYYWVVGHCLWSLLAATIGGALAHVLFSAPAVPAADRDAGPDREGRPARRWWLGFAVVGLAGLVTFTTLVWVGFRSDPSLWAGAVYLLTWGLLGFAVLGFACGQGKRRMIWFGAALFGLGFMVLNRAPNRFEESGYFHLVTDRFLIALRPWLPPVVSGFPAESAEIAAANARITKILARPVTMPFPQETTLEDVLTYIRVATRDSDGREITIYVDPLGLQEAEKTMTSPIRLDLAGLPLSVTLRVALRQLGMIYYVEDGILIINSEFHDDVPARVDYYLLLGHCLLALLAAGIGALLVPLVSERRAAPSA